MSIPPVPPPPLPPPPSEEYGVPQTLRALDEKVNQIVMNGGAAIAEIHRVIDAKDRLRKATMFVAALALILSSMVGYSLNQRCRDANKRDAKEVQVWEGAIAISANTPSSLTPDQRAAQVREFRAFLADIYRPRHCGVLYPLPLPFFSADAPVRD